MTCHQGAFSTAQTCGPLLPRTTWNFTLLLQFLSTASRLTLLTRLQTAILVRAFREVLVRLTFSFDAGTCGELLPQGANCSFACDHSSPSAAYQVEGDARTCINGVLRGQDQRCVLQSGTLTPPDSTPSGLSPGIVAAIAIAAVALCIALIACFLLRRKKRQLAKKLTSGLGKETDGSTSIDVK